jgi:hypothetical protein
MALNNENNSYQLVIPLGSPSADAEVLGAHVLHKSKLVSSRIMNGAAIAASDTDFVQLSLQRGATVIAELDTRAAHENGLADKVSKAMNIVAAEEVIAAGTDLKAVYNETDSGTAVALTGAVMILELVRL